ncbi:MULTISPECIES: triose-phosphate isomerase [Anaerolinea]|uniref:triose-phosphate isomerase n=1 Tax=Anaerolinea TaxID=233189 RepID=UPI002616B4EB|nr:triose-phosphate isomerase [Anaerolinea thermophila]
MRRKFVAGNWKMNKTAEEARLLLNELIPAIQPLSQVERAVCPPFPYLMMVRHMVEGTGIGVGAQNMHWEAAGAFTGEVSPNMVAEFCQYVILGHSERRTYFGETNETVNRKVKSALASGLTPIVCVGETLAENEASKTAEVVWTQITEGLKDLSPEDGLKLVIAYEPVWAIGTGRAATAEVAQSVHANVVRPALAHLFGQAVADQIRIQYGGSVTAKNAPELFAMPDIDGALVGGASLKPAEFAAIVQAAAEVSG